MTLVGLLLELPTGRGGEHPYVELPCQGVVVRCRVLDQAEEPRYEAAILFKDLEPDAGEIIDSYVGSQLSSPAD